MDLKKCQTGESNLSPSNILTITLLCHRNHKLKEQDSYKTEQAKLLVQTSLKWYVHAIVTCLVDFGSFWLPFFFFVAISLF